jgi:hypothetical protein
MLNVLLASVIAVKIPASPSAWTAQKPAVTEAVHRIQPHAQINSILIKQSYALVTGKGIHSILHRTGQTWAVACDLTKTTITPDALTSQCGVPATIAMQLATDEPINILASMGNFNSALPLRQAIEASATAPPSETGRARVGELQMLNTEMRLQQITRQQAIQQWSQLQYSWALPW